MPVSTTSPITILPATQSSGGSLKNSANSVRYQGSKRADADLWAAVAKALESGQNQIDLVMNTLRAPVALPDPIQILNPDGSLVAQIGHMLGSDNRSYPGIWAENLYVGVDGPDSANIVANENGVFLTNVPLVINSNDYTTTVANTATAVGTYGYLFHKNDGATYLRVFGNKILDRYLELDIGEDLHPSLLHLEIQGGKAKLTLGDESVVNRVVIDGGAGTVTTLSRVNAIGGFQVDSYVGVTGTLNAGTSLSISYGSAITSVFGPGISGFTQSLFVTGVTMNYSFANIRGGLIVP